MQPWASDRDGLEFPQGRGLGEFNATTTVIGCWTSRRELAGDLVKPLQFRNSLVTWWARRGNRARDALGSVPGVECTILPKTMKQASAIRSVRRVGGGMVEIDR
jgi:hypothetical protein